MSDKRDNTAIVFNSLVQNAIDFFNHSILEFENDPKYSVIHFYASVELFFKARLLLEHWSLILADPKKANYQKFGQGDFASVGLEESIQRLTEISGENFGKQEKDIFTNIKNHRNRLMHFYHSEYQSYDSKLLADIAAEQCRGWYYLHQLLTVNWDSKFMSYSDEISDLQTLMKKQNKFLGVRYEQIKNDIENEKTQGITYVECPSCGFPACKLGLEELGFANTSCLVCEDQSFCVKTTCPECHKNITIDKTFSCPNCKNILHFSDIINSLPDSVDKWAYCDKCKVDATPTIAKIGSEWFCFSCFTKYEDSDVGRCGWCGETVTGETGDYYNPGCFMCLVHIQREIEE